MTSEVQDTSWDTETGLINDVDGWIANPSFGKKEEYAQAVAATGAQDIGLMFMVDIIDAQGEVLGQQGWSVGSGWIPADDGSSISHPKRNNVVGGSRYGELQNRVVKELGVDMKARGKPTEAKSWLGLGFHWMQQEHTTVSGDTKTSLMPTELLPERAAGAPAAKAATPAAATSTPAAAAVDTTEVEAKLGKMAPVMEIKPFQSAALGMAEVVSNDALMATVLDESAEGFWATHQAA